MATRWCRYEGAVAPGGGRMKALVTGASGFLGRSIVRRLLTDGVAVRAFVRLGRRVDSAGAEVYEGDICDDAAVEGCSAGCGLGGPRCGAG